MKIFIPSYNRPNIIKVHKYFDAFQIDYRICLHNQEQYDLYKAAGTVDMAKVVITNVPVGMSVARQAILDQFVELGEWVMFCDDNVSSFDRVSDAFYNVEKLDVKADPQKFAEIFYQDLEAPELLQKVEETIRKAEKIGALACGFACNPNHFYREKKWMEITYLIGKCFMVKKTQMRYDLNVKAMDDFSFTAQNLLACGRVLVNNYISANKKHYEKGGVGDYEERLPTKIADCEYLMKKYRGLFRYKIKKDCHPKAELQLRLNSPKQLHLWRTSMGAR